MLTVYSANRSEAVNIVRRGPDYVDADTGLHFVVVEDDGGTLYCVTAEDDYTSALVVADGTLLVVDDDDAAARLEGYVEDNIVYYCVDSGSYINKNTPELLEWLQLYYGLRINPSSFPLFDDNGNQIFISSASLCHQTSQNRSYLAFNTGSGYYGVKPSAAGWAGKVLGCDMGKVDATDIPAVTANTLQGVHSDNNHDVLEGYNAWMFYLCAGAPRNLFE